VLVITFSLSGLTMAISARAIRPVAVSDDSFRVSLTGLVRKNQKTPKKSKKKLGKTKLRKPSD
jgi:hypothetical protein